MSQIKIGFALCGSYCTYSSVIPALQKVKDEFGDVTPIMSENSSSTDSRFGTAEEHMRKIKDICGKDIITTIAQAEPIGPKGLLDVLVIAPCTGNTLAKIAHGVTDTSVTMAAKAHLRNERPLVLAVATNDALSANAANIGTLLNRKNVYFVPFFQDDPAKKPRSLQADFDLLGEAIYAAWQGKQLQPIFAVK